jgi:large subunit ribosomal protein L29
MNANELRELHVNELEGKISEMQEELFNLRFQDKIGQLSNPVRLRIVKRDIARAKTVLHEQIRSTNVSNDK